MNGYKSDSMADDPDGKPFQFLPKLRGKIITVRMLPNHSPITGELVAHNPYEIVLQPVGKPTMIIFKHSIAYIEVDKKLGMKF